MNSVNLIGRQCRQSECKTSTNGKKFLEGAIAVSTAKNDAVFIDYTAFDSNAEIIGKYVNKGDIFGLTGKIAVNKWADKNGVNHTKFYVIIDKVDLCSNKKDNTEAVDEPITDDMFPFDM